MACMIFSQVRRPILVLSLRARSAEIALEMHRESFPSFNSDREPLSAFADDPLALPEELIADY